MSYSSYIQVTHYFFLNIFVEYVNSFVVVPATSAPSERIFSVAGLTVDARRSSPTASSVDKIVIVHENYHYLQD